MGRVLGYLHTKQLPSLQCGRVSNMGGWGLKRSGGDVLGWVGLGDLERGLGWEGSGCIEDDVRRAGEGCGLVKLLKVRVWWITKKLNTLISKLLN